MSFADVLVIPTRVVPRLADLKQDELASLMASVQHVGRVIERVYAADGLTIACQVRHHSYSPLPLLSTAYLSMLVHPSPCSCFPCARFCLHRQNII